MIDSVGESIGKTFEGKADAEESSKVPRAARSRAVITQTTYYSSGQ